MLHYINIVLFYVALLMLGYFNFALFDAPHFTGELLNVVLFHNCTINTGFYQCGTV